MPKPKVKPRKAMAMKGQKKVKKARKRRSAKSRGY